MCEKAHPPISYPALMADLLQDLLDQLEDEITAGDSLAANRTLVQVRNETGYPRNLRRDAALAASTPTTQEEAEAQIRGTAPPPLAATTTATAT